MGDTSTSTTGTRQQPGLACEECRRRKARCDRVRPQCGICAEAGRKCVVADKGSQRGPKKGQLKDLRSRVALLEQRLVGQIKDPKHDMPLVASPDESPPPREGLDEIGPYSSAEMGIDVDDLRILDFPPSANMPTTPNLSTVGAPGCASKDSQYDGSLASLCSSYSNTTSMHMGTITPMSPPSRPTTKQTTAYFDREVELSDLMQADLDLVYFERVHPIAPMIHKGRYFTWAGDESPAPARACLRSAMRTVASAMSAPLRVFGDALCTRTRRMLEAQDAHGDAGLPWMTRIRAQQEHIDHELIQAWLLLAHYEFLRRHERQALLTAGRAFRLLQLSRLFDIDAHDSDAPALEHSATSSSSMSSSAPQPASDDGWIETEEKRRTLWAAFVLDRLSSMLNDRPWMLHEEIICTRLPMPEAVFQSGQHPVRMGFLPESMGSDDGCSALPPFAECVVLVNLFGRCVAHHRLAQSIPLSGSESESKDFWARHEWLAATAATATRKRLQAHSTGAPARCDPMMSFNRILAYSASISLSATAEANPWQSLDGHLMTATYRQLAYQAATEVVFLIRTAPRIAFVKMHPFLPNAIALVASFLSAATPHLASPDEERLDGVSELLGALRYLSDVNNLARELLDKLGADMGRGTLSAMEVVTMAR